MRLLNQFFLLLFLSAIAGVFATKMDVVYEWQYIDYEWDSLKDKGKALNSGKYNFSSPILIDVDRDQDGRTFVTLAKTRGVPASLCVVSDKSGYGGPLLKPYPDWQSHKEGDCNSIINVYKISIDDCYRLWILDNGMIDDEKVCPDKLSVYDLYNDKLILQIPIEEKYSKNPKTHKGLLMASIVQTEGRQCMKEKVFMADVAGNGLLLLDYPTLWRFDLPSYFEFDSRLNLSSNEIPFTTSPLTKDRFGLALSPKIGKNQQHLFFRPYASRDIYAVNVNNIMEKKNELPLHLFDCYNKLPSASTAQAFGSKATLFFGLTKHAAIGCLNIFRKFQSENIEIIAQDCETLQFASGIKVIPPSKSNLEEELWVSTNLYEKLENKKMNLSKINFRILKQSVRKLIKGTKCDFPIKRGNSRKLPAWFA